MLLVFFNRVPYMQISDMIPGVNIIGRKVSIVSVMGWGVWGYSETPTGVLRGQSTLRKFLGSKEHLDLLEIDLIAAKIITVQD